MYVTRDDMVQAFGELECIKLTDRKYTGDMDDEVLSGALARASAEIDSYLVGRYPVPWPDTPGVLVGRCCDMARYFLCGAGTQVTEQIRERYEDAVRYLERVADGRHELGRTSDGQVVQQTSSGARFQSSGRAFDRNATGGGAF
ncbi:hypothetical protein CS369_21905 [Candidatus Symbiopectobacterium sp. 'North America']|uniref:gp436 family protein n=1 Tax=Candidatus Symbiopectobacterium sp. 'North America' TaxID=2794574 RepID=UPI0018CA9261|nr:DUF1320 domain-containing protein [Candidatus Symbiopectobacterium sp. 'North America']MBG6246705.1 hypothetical protein [Candidatus Symbiopectobacterium sp. 'North America']